MRSLWTAASGMTSQQQNVDTISNNISNINTTGYKRERLEFKSLLYETIQKADLDPVNQTGRPVNLQVGSGVRPIATGRIFTNGSLERTDYSMDFGLEGNGFFVVNKGMNPDGTPQITYTRDGSFKLSPTEDGGFNLVTSEGYQVLDTNDEPVNIPEGYQASAVKVTEEGNIVVIGTNNEVETLDSQFNIVQFTNVQGLETIGGNLYRETPASGEPIRESDGEVTQRTTIRQGFLEMSNVQIAEEMVNFIVAQRVYELNSKAITSSDEMLQTANNLKR